MPGIVEPMAGEVAMLLLIMPLIPELVLAKLGADRKLARKDWANAVFGRAVVPKKLLLPSRLKKA